MNRSVLNYDFIISNSRENKLHSIFKDFYLLQIKYFSLLFSLNFKIKVRIFLLYLDKYCPNNIFKNKFFRKMKKTFGEIIREGREHEGLPLRKVAAFIDIDPSTLSKIERGERSANKEMIPALAEILKISEHDLTLSLLSDSVAESLIYENNCSEILKVAEEKIKYFKSKNYQQGKLSFE